VPLDTHIQTQNLKPHHLASGTCEHLHLAPRLPLYFSYLAKFL
jgi:hypothetical protein